jgi:cytochrome c peroxidase
MTIQAGIRFLFLAGLFFVALGYSFSPYSNPTNESELGELLFFDPILSKDSSISCGSCHKPELAFADSVAISPGVGGVLGSRNAPSVMNMAFRSLFFYDGRAATIEDQVHFPIEDPLEMNLKMSDLTDRLTHHKKYSQWFMDVYNAPPSPELIAKAIAAFERSLETDDSPFDQYINGDRTKLSDATKRGRKLFLSEKAKCFDCHFSPDFTGDEFRNIGLYDEKKYKDKGRFTITKNADDLGKFKVPGLRNVAVTAPYMHDGSFKTLREVIDYYDNPQNFVSNPINMDTLLAKPLGLTEAEKDDLEAFLISLTDSRFLKQIRK